MRIRRRSRSSATGLSVSGSGSTRESPICLSESENEEESETIETHTPPALTTGDCRYCYGPQEASGTDPIIKVGCQCKGDNSNGHQSCLTKWFKDKLLMTLDLSCELCKGPLGAPLRTKILSRHLPERTPGPIAARLLIILLQFPLDALHQLRINPTDTPPFEALPPETQLVILDYLQRQAKKYVDEEIRRNWIYHTDAASALDGRGPRRPYRLQARMARAAELREQFVPMASVTRMREQAFFPRDGGTNMRIVLQGQGCFCNSKGGVLRIPAPATPLEQPDIEEFLEDLTLHSDLIAGDSEEDLIILPRSMIVDNIYTDNAPNNVASGSGDLAVAGGGSGNSAPLESPPAHREFTYGRYQRFFLHFVSPTGSDPPFPRYIRQD